MEIFFIFPATRGRRVEFCRYPAFSTRLKNNIKKGLADIRRDEKPTIAWMAIQTPFISTYHPNRCGSTIWCSLPRRTERRTPNNYHTFPFGYAKEKAPKGLAKSFDQLSCIKSSRVKQANPQKLHQHQPAGTSFRLSDQQRASCPACRLPL